MRRLVVKFLFAATAAASVVGGMPVGGMPAHSQATEVQGLAISAHNEIGMVQPADVQRNADGTLALTARGTHTDRASLVLILQLNNAATVAIYVASANADSLATICGNFISIPGICDVITLLAQPIQALGSPGPEDCLAFWAAAAIPPFSVGYLTC